MMRRRTSASDAPFRVLLAPSGFKEGPDARAVMACMERGVLAASPTVEVLRAPMVDGEGFTETIVEMAGGELHPVTVTDPVGRAVEARVGMIRDGRERIGIIETAAAAGLRLIPFDERDPRRTTSHGVGELIHAALDLGATRLIVGCGDSGVNDGGAGMAQALGVRLLDSHDQPLPRGGAALARLARIDLSARDPRIGLVRIEAAVNWQNMLLGDRGVSRVYGPQKGATPDTVEQLEAGLANCAAVVRRDLGIGLESLPGAGASGGLGAGLHALLGARLRPRFGIVRRFVPFDRLLKQADLVLTAEGRIDGQTAYGKVPSEVARHARRIGVPVIALAGSITPEARATLATGIDAYMCILKTPTSLAEAMDQAPALIAEATEQAVRFALAMRRIPGRRDDAAGRRTGERRPDGPHPASSSATPATVMAAPLPTTPSTRSPGRNIRDNASVNNG